MASLTETAYYTRKGVNYTILAVIGYIVLQISWGLLVTVYFMIFPPQAPPPNHAFGKLPSVKFPAATSAAQLTYRLETIEGSVPRASDAAMVFFMPKNPANLLALTKTQEFAKRIEFTANPVAESRYIYRFEDPAAPLRRMRYDIVSRNFVLRYGFEYDTPLFSERDVPLPDAAQSEAKSFLQSFGLYPDDLAGGSRQVTYLKLIGDKLVTTTSLSAADAVRVDFFRQSVADTPIVTPNPNEGPVSFTFSGSKNLKKRMLEIAYTYWPIEYGTTGTYAMKRSSDAWQELQTGHGYIARYPKKGNEAIIRRVYLAYYDSFEPQTYLQPVFVFEGDDGFLAYVAAVAPPWSE